MSLIQRRELGCCCWGGRRAAADGVHNGNSQRSIAGGKKKLPPLQKEVEVDARRSTGSITSAAVSVNAQCALSVSAAHSSALQPLSSIACTSPGL